MSGIELVKGLSDEKYRWRLVKRGKDVVSVFSSFLTIGAVAIGLLCGGVNEAEAGPVGGQITQGTGAISQSGTTTTIDQNTHRIDIDWRDFSSNVGDTITFNQPTNNAIAINRVTSGIPSNLRGELNANGRIFILNNAGITFHKGSQTNVGSLIATTAKEIDIDDNGVAHFSESGDAAVINEGDIIVSEGGFAVLVAPQVSNSGFIRADLGRIEMGSATEFTFDMRGDGTILYKLTEEQLENAGLSNTGILQAKSGTVNLSANIASDIRKAVVNLDGLIDADSFGEGMDGGTVLVSSRGDINMNGTVKGKEVRVVADDTMNFNEGAKIEGGFAEVSGKEHIDFKGEVKAEKLLIDPATMTITDGVAGVDQIQEETIEALSQGGTDVLIEADNAIIMEDLSDNELTGGSGNITMNGLTATSSITFNDTADTIRTTSGDITMTAGSGGISVGNLATGGAAIADPGMISLTTTSGGDIATGSLTVQGVGTGTGASLASPFSVQSIASLVSDGDITINGNVNISSDATVLSGGYGEAYSLLDLRANATSGTTTVNGDVTVDGSANGNDAAVVLSHSIVGIKSYDTSITGSLNQSTSLSGTYTQQGDNYVYTFVNDGNAYIVPSLSEWRFPYYLEISWGRTDYEPIAHTSIDYTNALAHDVTIGGDLNSTLTNTSIGNNSSDYTLASMRAETGTFTVGGTTNVSQDTTIDGASDLVYNRDLDFELYGSYVSLGDVNVSQNLDVLDSFAGNLDTYYNKDFHIIAENNLQMGVFNTDENIIIGATTTPDLIKFKRLTYGNTIEGNSVVINGDYTTDYFVDIGATSANLIDINLDHIERFYGSNLEINGNMSNDWNIHSASLGNTVYRFDPNFIIGTNGNSVTINGSINSVLNAMIEDGPSNGFYSDSEINTIADDFLITGDINIFSSVVGSNTTDPDTYIDGDAYFQHRYTKDDATFSANSINIDASTIVNGAEGYTGSGVMLDGYYSNTDLVANIANGIDVSSYLEANGDTTWLGGWSFIDLRPQTGGYITLNTDHLNVDNIINAGTYSVSDGLSADYTELLLKGANLNVDRDITINSEVTAGLFPQQFSELANIQIDIINGSIVNADNFILNASANVGSLVDGTSDTDAIFIDFDTAAGSSYYATSNADSINLSGDFIVNSSFSMDETPDFARGITDDFNIVLDGDFHANSIQVDTDMVGTIGEAIVDINIEAAGDITLDSASNLSTNAEYAGSPSSVFEGENNLVLVLNGANVSTGDVALDTSVSGIEGVNFEGTARNAFSVDATGTATLGDVSSVAYSESNDAKKTNSVTWTSIVADGAVIMGDYTADSSLTATGDAPVTASINDLYIASNTADVTMGNITTNATIDAEDGTSSEIFQSIYVDSVGDLNAGNFNQISNITSDITSECATSDCITTIYVDNTFDSETGSIDMGNVDIYGNLVSERAFSDWHSERVTNFAAIDDITLGSVRSVGTGTMDTTTPYSATNLTTIDRVSMISDNGSITTGSQTVSSVATAPNVSVDNASSEATLDISAAGNITTGGITTNAEMLVDRADTEVALADLRVENDVGNITVNGSVFVNGIAEQTEIDDPTQVLHAYGSGIFNAEHDLTINGNFTSHGYTIADDIGVDADVFAQTFAWMMGGYGSGYGLDADLATGPMLYYPQHTIDKPVFGQANTTLRGELESIARTSGVDGVADATASIISSSNDIWFANTGKDPLVIADGGFVQQRVWGQDPSKMPDIATLILLNLDPNPWIPPVDPTYRIPDAYEFAEFVYPRMRTEYVFFDWDKHNIDEEALKKLRRIYEEYSATGISKLFIEGHTDLSGPDNYNEALAKKRAAEASMMLEALGLDRSQQSIKTLGELYPYVPTQDGVRIRENRRVKIRYLAVY